MTRPAPASPPVSTPPVLAVRHVTRYVYQSPVDLGHRLLHLRPRRHPDQTISRPSLVIAPAPEIHSQRVDPFGNPVDYLSHHSPHTELVLDTRFRAAVSRTGREPTHPDYRDVPWEAVAEAVRHDLSEQGLLAFQSTFDTPMAAGTPELAAFAADAFTPGRPMLEATAGITSQIHTNFRFDPLATTVATPVSEVLSQRCGVCQDFAHLMIAALRSLGLPARYVSGYLRTLPPPGQPRLQGADASHAWVEVYVHPSAADGAGAWFGFDPTNDCPAGPDHVVLAVGRDYQDVAPARGLILGGGFHTVQVEVDVVRDEGG